jgi:hypothetical protein
MRTTRNGMRQRTLLLAALLTIGLAAAALGFWTATGSGTATTALESPNQLTLSPGIPQAELTPGGRSSVAVIATNSNPYFVRIGSLALDTAAVGGGFVVDPGHSGCDPSVLHLAPQDNGGAGWRVPPQVASTDGTQVIDLSDALGMDASAASACQGASFTVDLVAGA